MADGVLLVDKPAGITSTRALSVARRALGSRKAGHTGTLDPFATGLLPLAFGEATKFSRFLIDAAKSYEAVLRLGAETASGDTETPEIAVSAVVPDSPRIDEVLRSFTGDQLQIPPMHSAVHVQGRRLYEYAREGIEVEREPRRVHIAVLRRLRLEGNSLAVSVTCSKGTYVRVLAQDLGRALGCGAYLTELRRTAVGPLVLADATPLEDIAARGAAAGNLLLPPETLVASLPRIELDEASAWRFRHGQVVETSAPSVEAAAAYAAPARFLGVGRVAAGLLEPVRLLADDAGEP